MDKPLALLCVVEDPAISPSSRLRIYQHLETLRKEGIAAEVVLQPKSSAEWKELLARAGGFDAVLWQKVLMSHWNALRLRMASRRLLFDLDDAVWMGKRNHVPYHSGKQARRFWFLVKLLDGAICGSPVLDQKVLSIVPKLQTHLVPTSVPALPLKASSSKEELPVLVWVGMGPNVAQVEAIEEELLRTATVHPYLLRIVSNRRPNFRTFQSWEFIEWSEESEYEVINSADIGIMPLVDDGFTRGKCAYKALQYMSCGLPVVASDVGVNREWIQQSGAGLVVPAGSWDDALGELLADPERRSRMGRRGWQSVQDRFSHERVGPQLAASLREQITFR